MHDIAICQVTGRLVVASSDVKGCDKSLLQEERVAGNIVLVERGDCMFIEKGRVLQVSYYLKQLDTVLGIRSRIRMFLGLPDPEPIVRYMDPYPAPAPDPSLFS
jgi:hypothetical protein